MDASLLHPILHYAASTCSTGSIGCGAPTGNTSQFWSTTLGGAVGAVLSALGVVVVLIAVIKGGMDAFGGKLGKSFKVLLVALFFGVMMIEPALIGDLISLFATIVHDIVNSISSLVGGGSNTGGTTPTTVG